MEFENVSVYIEKMYNTCMWVTDRHRHALYSLQKKNNLSIVEIQALVEKNAEIAKRDFSKVLREWRIKKDTTHCPFVCSLLESFLRL